MPRVGIPYRFKALLVRGLSSSHNEFRVHDPARAAKLSDSNVNQRFVGRLDAATHGYNHDIDARAATANAVERSSRAVANGRTRVERSAQRDRPRRPHVPIEFVQPIADR